MKPYIPEIRVISVEHARTILAETRLRHALDKHDLRRYPVRGVFCHLEAGRCGVKAGVVALEVDGRIIWAGKELTQDLAEQFCAGLPDYVRKTMAEYGISSEPPSG
ncbi:MAG: hypothetical protein LBN28_03715 [Desulfovibrio sp.]|jgi:hypothetical protein|nr:hypothetical protein [Desulfovibrio sp.]